MGSKSFSSAFANKFKLDIKEVNHFIGNYKRIQNCKVVGGHKKVLGHLYENMFVENFDKTYIIDRCLATSDILIYNNSVLYQTLNTKFNLPDRNIYTSLKSGKNIQFHLGKKIEEFDNIDNLYNKYYIYSIFNTYLGKEKSQYPADLLCYKFNTSNDWVFFFMPDIIEYITSKCKWRILKTGRIKGDFCDNTRKGVSQYITYEYRKTHKSFFLGANCNKGYEFIKLLMSRDCGVPYLRINSQAS